MTDFLSSPNKPTGSLEETLKDARRKVQELTRTALEVENEKQKWASIVTQLQGALDILQGKVPVHTNGEVKIVKGRWPGEVLKFLQTNKDVVQAQVYDHLVAAGCPSRGAAYQVVMKMKQKGVIFEQDGVLQIKQGE